jgi:signal transduction histidine kinase
VTGTKKPRVLIVEDSKTQAEIILYYLDEEGYEAVWVDSPASAFKALSQSPFDLILTDIIMPGMDGYTFCKGLKNNPEYSSIPIIIITQLSNPTDIIKGLCCGANNFIIKPVRREQLIREISILIQNGPTQSKPEACLQEKIPFMYDGHEFSISSSREDLLRTLISIYQTAALKNSELERATRELNEFTSHLEELVKKRTQALSVTNEVIEHLLIQRNELITRIGHDLKTPLTPLYAFLPYLQKKETDEEKKEILSVLVEDVTVLKKLVERILKLSHITPDSISGTETRSDLYQISVEVLGNHSYMIEQKDITVVNNIRAGTYFRTSHFHAMTMLDNLVSNAILYNKDNGMITLSCEKEGKLQVISVEDTGIGLTKDQTERVFDDFYKADISRHDHNVHGLGLSIVRRIISLYGGTVTAKSPGLGLGSNFQIYLAGEDVRSDATLSEYGG